MPIYFRSYGVPSDADLNLQQIVHTSLDIIEEETSWEATSSTYSDPRDYYLGLLTPTEDHKVYGYSTNTRVKFVLITDSTSHHGVDSEIKAIFKSLHQAYAETVANPFYLIGEKIHTKKFDNAVLGIFQRSRSSSM